MNLVIKISGKNIDREKDSISLPVKRLWDAGHQVALVHGGGPQITSLMNRLGREARFVEGLRITGAEDMDITEMALSGSLNKALVGMLFVRGVPACGISGRDAGLLIAEQEILEREGEKIDLGRVGKIVQVNPALVEVLWAARIVPVISPVSTDRDGRGLNVNADWAAVKLAEALRVEQLFLFTDVPGVLADLHDPATLIRELPVVEIDTLIVEKIAGGGMLPKLRMAQEAISVGVREVFIAGGGALDNLDAFLTGGGTLPATRVF
ncbi:MAG TPA: acetylglutamate kinase [Atribacteraceae bacterium]|nr:acetylglutamate kinase [Atribacteraceae bacterium]